MHNLEYVLESALKNSLGGNNSLLAGQLYASGSRQHMVGSPLCATVYKDLATNPVFYDYLKNPGTIPMKNAVLELLSLMEGNY